MAERHDHKGKEVGDYQQHPVMAEMNSVKDWEAFLNFVPPIIPKNYVSPIIPGRSPLDTVRPNENALFPDTRESSLFEIIVRLPSEQC